LIRLVFSLQSFLKTQQMIFFLQQLAVQFLTCLPAGGLFLMQLLEKESARGEAQEKELNRVLEEIRLGISGLKEKQQEIIIRKTENAKNLERWRAEKDRAKLETKNIEWQLAEILQEKETLKKHLLEKKQDVLQLQERIKELAEQLQAGQEELKARRIEKVKKNEHLTELRIDMATIQEKIVSFQKDMDYYVQRLKQLAQQKQEKKNELVLVRNKRKELEENCQTLTQDRESQQVQLLELEQQLESLKRERLQVQEKIMAIGQEVKKYGGQLHSFEEKIHQIELQQSRFETALESCVRRLNEQFALTPEEAEEKVLPVQNRTQAVERISLLKEEISALGPVNPGAIEEYQKLTERLAFLQSQVQDMSEARDKLLEVIKEMNQIMVRRLNETFTKVNQCFQEIFQQLFGGGRAQLLMNDAEDPLEAGIEIIAQPPGKKPQTLTLLSGGEKALTAIALLMAMLKTKPSPFCVLDEIESNLDEANVLRFAKLLQEFAGQSQFITISHHRATMETADVLYGVTIEESGVSRLLSVRLEDVRDEAS
jgi:chromosome segregation protein